MIHKKRENRRYMRNKKVEKRLKLMETLGERGGTLFEKHVAKIHENGGGYMSKHGTLTHYSNKSHAGRKTRHKNNDYGPSEIWDRNSKRQIDDMNHQIDEYKKNK